MAKSPPYQPVSPRRDPAGAHCEGAPRLGSRPGAQGDAALHRDRNQTRFGLEPPSVRMKRTPMLSLVLPKGSLEKATLDLFDAADLTVRRGSDRDYHASVDDPRIDRVRFLRPQEIPTYLERGLFDIGITGRDWITETQADVVSLGELQYSK